MTGSPIPADALTARLAERGSFDGELIVLRWGELSESCRIVSFACMTMHQCICKVCLVSCVSAFMKTRAIKKIYDKIG